MTIGLAATPEMPPWSGLLTDLSFAIALLIASIALMGWAYETRFWAIRLLAGTAGGISVMTFACYAVENSWPSLAWMGWMVCVSLLLALLWVTLARLVNLLQGR